MERTGSTPSKKLDYKRELRELYGLQAGPPMIVDVPELSFLMVDGIGIRTRPGTTWRAWRLSSPSPTA
jgi:hypothetical protein